MLNIIWYLLVNAYPTAPSASYTLPALTVGSYSIASQSSIYQIWLTTANGKTAICTSTASSGS